LAVLEGAFGAVTKGLAWLAGLLALGPQLTRSTPATMIKPKMLRLRESE
jgi:hypothetical protein